MFNFFKKSLAKTLGNLSKSSAKIDKQSLEDLLLEADIAYEIVEEIIYYLPPADLVKKADLKRVMGTYFLYDTPAKSDAKPFVELILGVNGAGKTTSVAKLANLYKKAGLKPLLAASDTFRAGAVEQIKLWAKELGLEIVASDQGHDPSAVAYDAISKAKAREYDKVLIDTAGRLENQKNLANELDKIVRVCAKAMQGAPHRKLLVLDGTQGSSAYIQAKSFNSLISLDGVIITKLDGTARGGALFSVARELELPILYIGVGEGADDLIAFEPKEFVSTLVDGIYGDEG